MMRRNPGKNSIGLFFARNWFPLVLVLALVAAPLFFRGGSEFAGTDNAAKDVIAELRPGIKPWAKPLWTPPGGEIESLLFALQAAAGAGFIGYFFGLQRGRREAR